jgi:hypothetical protein
VNEKEYLILLDADTRKRHYHAIEVGKIIRFMVQLEVKMDATWKEVVRYDCAHDYVHKDCDALTFADEDIDDNWQIYRERFLRGEFP